MPCRPPFVAPHSIEHHEAWKDAPNRTSATRVQIARSNRTAIARIELLTKQPVKQTRHSGTNKPTLCPPLPATIGNVPSQRANRKKQAKQAHASVQQHATQAASATHNAQSQGNREEEISMSDVTAAKKPRGTDDVPVPPTLRKSLKTAISSSSRWVAPSAPACSTAPANPSSWPARPFCSPTSSAVSRSS